MCLLSVEIQRMENMFPGWDPSRGCVTTVLVATLHRGGRSHGERLLTSLIHFSLGESIEKTSSSLKIKEYSNY